MSTFANQLKLEISRLAKKEVRAEIQVLKKTSTQHRSEIAATTLAPWCSARVTWAWTCRSEKAWWRCWTAICSRPKRLPR